MRTINSTTDLQTSDVSGETTKPAPNPASQPSTLKSELYTAAQAAKYLNCGLRTIWDWEADGGLACVRHGRWVRFAKSDLDAVIAKWRVPARIDRPRKRRMIRITQEGRNA